MTLLSVLSFIQVSYFLILLLCIKLNEKFLMPLAHFVIGMSVLVFCAYLEKIITYLFF